MTSALVEVAHDEWPTDDLYHSPLGLYEFQAEGIADVYFSSESGGGRLVCWDTGTGKSHAGMRLSTLFAEDARDGRRKHDLTVLVCEKGKISEWLADFGRYTRQSARIHHGTGRLERLERDGLPQVLITTYETARTDLMKVVPSGKGRGKKSVNGPLMDLIEGLSVLWVCDEMTKLRNRSSGNYKAFEYTFRKMRKSHPKDHRVVGLTATPIERDYEDAFNQIRLIRPDLMPTVAEFEAYFVRGRDPYGRPRYHNEARMQEFVAMCQPVLLRKRKTDPDVVAQFPSKVEESMHLEMGPEQAALYAAVEALADPEDPEDEPLEIPGLWTILRQIAGSPAALLYSDSAIAQVIVEEWGADRLLAMPSAKQKALIEYLAPLVKGQGAKAVVFTFFGQSVLRVLSQALRAEGFKVYENHGGLSASEMGEVRREFKEDPAPCVFLTSDAGSRGINLPEATYVVEYESALTYANRTQRLDRIHRIDSQATSVTCMTLILDKTVEVPIIEKVIARNRQTDLLLGDTDAGEDFLTSSERRAALRIGRLTKKTRQRPAA
jgi:SNF2 family DNA or RNA helicase